MRMLKLSSILLLACAAGQPVFAQYKVGDRLVVIAGTEVKVGDTVKEVLGRGQDVRVDAVNGDFLWVKHLSTGWIRNQNVRTPALAIDLFKAQVTSNPLDAGAYCACGITRTDLNQFDLAIADFDQAIRLGPQISAAYNGRGICWVEKGELDKAIADYTEAIRLNPRDTAVALVNRARVWNVKGDFPKTIADATEAIRIAPEYTSAYSIRAQASAAMKEFDKSIADCEQIHKTSFGGLTGYNDVAWLLATSPDGNIRDGKQAVEFAKRACKSTNWSDGAVLDTAAVAFAEAGDFDQAVKWGTKAVKICSDRDRADFESRLTLFKSGKSFQEIAN